jgi:outer membrane receptor protein involved in Fe transport
MDRIPSSRVKKKDRTGVFVSIVLHAVVIAISLFLLSRTEIGKQLLERTIGATRQTKKREEKPKPPPTPTQPRQRPKAAPDAPPPSRGARATDAPAAAGESFFSERTEKKGGPSSAGEGGRTNVLVRIAAPPPKAPPPPKLFSSSLAKSDIKQLLAERAKATASTEAIGTEQISKTGVSDAGAIIRQISGATVSDGKFAVIRGLNDRYISTTLNGANLPSADPYRQSAPLDLFPAQVIDRVVVTKTFSPDQPGTATGGGIDVFTKSFPERDFASVSLGGEYNTQSSLNDRFLTYDGGGHDWAAMDDGTRALPDAVNQLTPINPTGQPIPSAPTTSPRIGTPAFFTSVSNVAVLDKVTKALGTTQFAPHEETAPLNHNFSMAGGGTGELFSNPFGYFASSSYKHDYGFYEDGVSRRYQNGTEVRSSYRDARSLNVVNWSGMVNLAYRPLENHELGFTFFYNQNGTDDARIQDQGFEENAGGTFRKFNLYYTERNLTTYQIKGTHAIPEVGNLQFNWLVALTQTTQDEPDARFFNDNDTGNGYESGGNGVPAPSKPTRYFRALDEHNRNEKLDWTLPFRDWTDDEGNLKFGMFNTFSDRTFTERQLYYPGHGDYNSDPNRYLRDENLGLIGIQTNRNNLTFFWGDYVQSFDSLYNGDRTIWAGYLSLDVPIAPNLRLVGGARYETTDLRVHSESYLASSITGQEVNDTHLVQEDLLPAAGLIFAATPKMNFRLNYSQTIARPSFRELAAYYSYDPVISDYIEGNPLLKMSAIDNYDFRYEWFPKPGELFSVSVFYKDLKDAIERGNIKLEGDVITFRNYDAKLYGIEFEGRKGLAFLGEPFDLFSLGGNLSLVKSVVNLSETDLDAKRRFLPNADSTRPLYDQSPFVFNADLNYSNPGIGTSATMIFNVSGPRIAITKLNTDDVYERATPTLDFIVSQRIGRHTTFKFGAKNLLDPKIERTYGKDTDRLYSSYKKGRAFGLSVTYDF